MNANMFLSHGVYYLRDQRSRVFNFDPYLEKIMPVSEFDFSLLKDYITSSRDTTLLDIAKRCEAQFVGSTSTMTGLLTQLHFLISSWRGVNTSMLSKSINVTTTKFTKMTMAPSSVFLRWRDGVYALDADKSGNPSTILSFLGRSLEKLLLLPTTEFERYRKSNENPINASEQKVPEAYHYTKFGTMLMRSQLDAYDSRLPGSGVFDIKTRAAITIRMDQNEGEASKGYEIRYPHGDWQSYEREYYDLLRSSLLKFSLQVRMGRMDGIYLAYHNVDRLFGFQYMSVSEMDLAIHGQMDTTLGDQEFRASLGILQEILNRATEAFPQQSSRITFHTMEGDSPAMNVFIAPVAEEEIEAMSKSTDDELKELQQLQTKARAHSTASFSTGSENIVNDASRPPVQTFEASPEDGEAKVSQNALEKKSDALLDPPPGSIGLVITVENRVNGKKVDRPRVLTSAHRWTVDFKVKDMPSSSVGRPYRHCQLARKKLFDRLSKDTDVSNPYVNKLRELATRGRSWRKTQDAIDERRENVVFEPYAPTAHGNGKEIDSTKVNTAEKIKGPGDYMTWLYTNACKA